MSKSTEKPGWYIDISESTDEEPYFRVERTLGPYPNERLATRTETGVLRQLDIERFWTMVRVVKDNGEQRVSNRSIERFKESILSALRESPSKKS